MQTTTFNTAFRGFGGPSVLGMAGTDDIAFIWGLIFWCANNFIENRIWKMGKPPPMASR